jgi:hypothetical protein
MTRLMDRRRPLPIVALVGLLALAVAGPLLLDGCAPAQAGVTGSPATSPGSPLGGPTTGVGRSAVPSPDRTAEATPEPSAGPTTIPTPTPAPQPSPTPAPSPTSALIPPPRPGPFEMDLYHRGDFVTEKMPIWCAPAALQTMINIMSPGSDTTRATQKLLHKIARRLGPAPDKGSEPEGEARTLTSLDYGRYTVIAVRTRAAAFKAAARAIRLTGRPAALLVWRGAHNWVVSGFRATADPALGDDFRVTHLWIEDVWYPRISSIWGRSRPPDSLVPVRLLPQDYLPWRRPTGRYPGKDGKFVLIIPVAG